jgi:excisionase family DNA binding protein
VIKHWTGIVVAVTLSMPRGIFPSTNEEIFNMLEALRAKRSAMTVKELADILSLSQREIYKLAASNQIPHFKVGSSVRFEPSMVLAWLEARMLIPATRRSPSSVRPTRERLSNIA